MATEPQSPVRAAISAEHLVRRFGGFTAVNDVTFRVEKGEIFGFLGPNGSGKTTVIKMLTGLLPLSGGSALVEGLDVRTDSEGVRERRSEEHTSELQSRQYLVCRLLLEKQKGKPTQERQQ